MTWLAEFTLPPAEFPLGRVFEGWPTATVELDRIVPCGGAEAPSLSLWVHADGEDLPAVRAVLEELPALRSAALVANLGDRGLFRAEWDPEHVGVVDAVAAAGVTVVSGVGSTEGWTCELRAERAEQFSAFREYCEDHGIGVTLGRLRRLSDVTTATEYDLTPEQHAALVLAYTEGYYDEPSRTDQEALATRLGISHQALSARLRRGYRNLIGSTIAEAGGRDT